VQVLKMIRLSDLTITIFSGFSFRTKVQDDQEGDLLVVQMKDLNENYSGIGSHLTKVKSEGISNKMYLQKGDVLFIGKGANNHALEFNMDYPKVIAASAFFVIRPDQDRLRSGYLTWYINQPPVQQYLKENMAGTYIPNINKVTVENIMMVLPPLDVQRKIEAIDKLKIRERSIMNDIMRLRDKVVSNSLLDLIKEPKNANI
jgi:hypothetical protein